MAIGVFALTVVTVIGLMSPLARSVAAVSDHDKAALLGDAIQTELVRLRDHLGGATAGLDAVGALADSSDTPFTLVGSADGTRVVRETDAVDAATTSDPLAVPLADRTFLITVRRQPAFPYVGGNAANRSAFLAVTATIVWPYHRPDGTLADASQRSSLSLNFALTP